MLPKNRTPIGPGEILKDFLAEYNMSQRQFSIHLGWKPAKVNEIIQGKRGITPAIALALSDAFGNSPEFWLNAQRACDLWKALRNHKKISRLQDVS